MHVFRPEGAFERPLLGVFETNTHRLGAEGPCEIRVHCKGMTDLAWEGVGALVSLAKRAKRLGGRLAVNLDLEGTRIKNMLGLTKLALCLPAEDEGEDAAGVPSKLIPAAPRAGEGRERSDPREPDDVNPGADDKSY